MYGMFDCEIGCILLIAVWGSVLGEAADGPEQGAGLEPVEVITLG
jgi:hypothetical protein